MNTQFQNDIFLEPSQDNGCEEPFFLDITDVFNRQYFPLINDHQDSPQIESVNFHFENFGSLRNYHESGSANPSQTENHEKLTFKSSYNKNVCFNICQKTAKVIKKGIYEKELVEICDQFEVEVSQFKSHVMDKKKFFSGPKALSAYIEERTKESQTFRVFMKWFLTEKYLRFALNEGEMKDIKAYVEYKNQVILPLLE